MGLLFNGLIISLAFLVLRFHLSIVFVNCKANSPSQEAISYTCIHKTLLLAVQHFRFHVEVFGSFGLNISAGQSIHIHCHSSTNGHSLLNTINLRFCLLSSVYFGQHSQILWVAYNYVHSYLGLLFCSTVSHVCFVSVPRWFYYYSSVMWLANHCSIVHFAEGCFDNTRSFVPPSYF